MMGAVNQRIGGTMKTPLDFDCVSEAEEHRPPFWYEAVTETFCCDTHKATYKKSVEDVGGTTSFSIASGVHEI